MQSTQSTTEMRATDTAPGVRALRDLWDIQTEKHREAAPRNVSSDIYQTKVQNAIPRRSSSHH